MFAIRETLVPGLFIVFWVVYAVSVRGLPKESTVFPHFLMAVMLLLLVVIVVQEFLRGRRAAPAAADSGAEAAPIRMGPPTVVYAASILFLVVFWLTNFIIASIVYTNLVMIYFGIKPVKSVILSLGFTAAMYVVFGKMFFVNL